MRMMGHHKLWCDVEGLAVEVGVVSDYSQDKRVIGHHNLNIVRLSGDSLEVSNWEVNPPGSLILYEPNQDNVCLVIGWGVVRQGGGASCVPQTSL